jgi:hypothetical protein
LGDLLAKRRWHVLWDEDAWLGRVREGVRRLGRRVVGAVKMGVVVVVGWVKGWGGRAEG